MTLEVDIISGLDGLRDGNCIAELYLSLSCELQEQVAWASWMVGPCSLVQSQHGRPRPVSIKGKCRILSCWGLVGNMGMYYMGIM